jgi:uncharacterized protein (DUF1778 family)
MPHLQQRSREERNASPIHVRVSPAERVTITDKAVTSGYSLSEFARQAMLNWSPAVAADGRVGELEARVAEVERIIAAWMAAEDEDDDE